jgi:hypothetical protein
MTEAGKPIVVPSRRIDRDEASPASSQSGGESGVLADLEGLSDDELQQVSVRAAAIVTEREKAKREQAIADIQRIAKEHGLKVTIKDPSKKRGRPPKAKAGPAAKPAG